MGVNGTDPLGLEISANQSIIAFNRLVATPEEKVMLRAFLSKRGNKIVMGDIWGDSKNCQKRSPGYYNTGIYNYHIGIEEDLESPYLAALHLREQLYAVLGRDTSGAGNMRDAYLDNSCLPDHIALGVSYKAQLNQARQATQTAMAAVEAGLSVANEGVDLVITLKDLSEGQWASAVGLLPFIPSTAGKVIFKHGDEILGAVKKVDLDNVDLSRVVKVNNRVPINSSKYAGKYIPLTDLPLEIRQKYPHSVYFSKAGYPDFSRYAKEQVRINLTGYRAKDEDLANAVLGLKRTPDGFTWHHHQEAGLMQLISTDLHNAVRHTGGVATSGIQPYK